MHRDRGQDGRIQRTVLQFFLGRRVSHNGKALHLVEHVPTVQESPEHRVEVVEMGLSFVTEKELGSIRIRSLVGHGQHASLVVHVVGVEFVGKGHVAPNGLAALGAGLVRGITSLHHKALDVAVHLGPIVGSTGAESNEVKGGARGCIAVDFQFEVAERGVEGHGHGCYCYLYLYFILVVVVVVVVGS
jgi:hypothetical protein